MSSRLADLVDASALPSSPRLRASARQHALLAVILLPLAVVALVATESHSTPEWNLLGSSTECGILALALFVATHLRWPRRLAMGLAIGAATACADAALRSWTWGGVLAAAGAGTLAYLVVRAVTGGTAARAERVVALDISRATLVAALLIVASVGSTAETQWLFPRTWDAASYRLDATFPVHAFHVGRLLAASAPLRAVARFVYDGIFLLLPVAYAMQVARRDRTPADFLSVAVCLCLLGALGYVVTPVAGPIYAFFAQFPNDLPHLERLPTGLALVPETFRNCMPSVHTSWALVLVWNARPFHRAIRAIAWGVLGFMVLATLGFGYHYVIDLVAAVPFAAAVQIGCTSVPSARDEERRRAVILCAALASAWIVLPRLVVLGLDHVPGLVPVLAIVTVVVAVLAEQRIASRASTVAEDESPASPREGHLTLDVLGVSASAYIVAFVISVAGMASMTKLTTELDARALLVAAVVVGLALLLRPSPLVARLLGLTSRAQLGVALASVLLVPALAVAPRIYGLSAAGAGAGSLRESAALGLAGLVVGAPLAIAGRGVVGLMRSRLRDRVAAFLVAGSVSGVALGGLVLLPRFGVTVVLSGCAALALSTAVVSWGLRTWLPRTGSRDAEAMSDPSAQSVSAWRARAMLFALVLALFGGRAALVHLLTLTSGGSTATSALAWALAFAGVFVGGVAARSWSGRFRPSRTAVVVAGIGLAAWTIFLPFCLRGLDAYYASFAPYGVLETFADREIVRAFVWAGFVVPWFACAGALLFSGEESSTPPWDALAAARLAPFAFVAAELLTRGLVPRWGGALLLPLWAAIAVGVSAARARGTAPLAPMTMLALAVAIVAPLAVAVGAPFGVAPLLANAGDAFSSRRPGEALSVVESGERHVVSVEEHRNNDVLIRALLRDGRIVGDDAAAARDQVALVTAALQHATSRGSALRIGYETGAVARVLAGDIARSIDVVEPDGTALDMATRFFLAPSMPIVVAEPRPFLLRSEDAWDVVSVASTSPARAGASIFSLELARLVRLHLRRGGVFEQGLAWNELRPGELTTILATLRAAFDQLWLYRSGARASIVACASPCPPKDADAGHLTLLLTPEGVDRWLASPDEPGAIDAPTTDDDLRIDRPPAGRIADSVGFTQRLAARLSRAGTGGP